MDRTRQQMGIGVLAAVLLIVGGLIYRAPRPDPRSPAPEAAGTSATGGDVEPGPRPSSRAMDAGGARGRNDADDLFLARFEDALRHEAQEDRHLALRELAGTLAGSNPALARRILERLMAAPGRAGQANAVTFLEAFQDAFATRDPAGAAAWAEGLTGAWREIGLAPVARRWAVVDVAGALSWSDGLGTGAVQTAVLRAMGQALESAGTAEATLAWARHVAARPDGGKFANAAGRIWARVDAEGAVQWAGTLPSPEEQGTALVAIASGLADIDPRRAGEWVGRFPAGEYRERAAVNTATVWAGRDPAAAAAWVEGAGDPRLLEATFQAIARSWRDRDPAGAEAWISRVNVPSEAKEYLRQF